MQPQPGIVLIQCMDEVVKRVSAEEEFECGRLVDADAVLDRQVICAGGDIGFEPVVASHWQVFGVCARAPVLRAIDKQHVGAGLVVDVDRGDDKVGVAVAVVSDGQVGGVVADVRQFDLDLRCDGTAQTRIATDRHDIDDRRVGGRRQPAQREG